MIDRTVVKRSLPLLLMLVVTLVLAFAVRGFVREVIVVPVLYAGWFTWLALTNLPHWIFWGIVVLVTITFAVRSLPGPKRAGARPKQEKSLPQGPVSTWTLRLSSSHSESSSSWRVARELGHIFWETRFPDEAFQMQRFLERMDDPAMAMPPAIRDYFEAGLARPQPIFRTWLRRPRTRTPSPLDLDPAVVLHFLEETFAIVSTPSVPTDPVEGSH